jgi:hypothetical protein
MCISRTGWGAERRYATESADDWRTLRVGKEEGDEAGKNDLGRNEPNEWNPVERDLDGQRGIDGNTVGGARGARALTGAGPVARLGIRVLGVMLVTGASVTFTPVSARIQHQVVLRAEVRTKQVSRSREQVDRRQKNGERATVDESFQGLDGQSVHSRTYHTPGSPFKVRDFCIPRTGRIWQNAGRSGSQRRGTVPPMTWPAPAAAMAPSRLSFRLKPEHLLRPNPARGTTG